MDEFLDRWKRRDPTLVHELVSRFNWSHPGDRVLVTATRKARDGRKHRQYKRRLAIGNTDVIIEGVSTPPAVTPNSVSIEQRKSARQAQLRVCVVRGTELGEQVFRKYSEKPELLDECWDGDAIDGIIPLGL